MKNEPINLQYTTIKDPLPKFIYQGLEKYSSEANAYKPQPVELVERLAEKHHIPQEMIYLTAGCDEAIHMFIHAYGKNTYTFTPTYVVYSDAKEFGKEFKEVYSIRLNNFEIVPEKLGEASLIFLANPNNPCGYTSKEKIIELVKNNPQAIVVVDEAYGDFAELSLIDEIKNYSNMAVIKSFSKGYSMAGNRIGYIIATPEIIAVVRNKAQWSNVSYLSIGAAVTALENEDYFAQMRKMISDRRENFENFLKSENLIVLPSKINAVVIKFYSEREGERFYNYLLSQGIVTSLGNGNSNIGLDKSYVRIAIGNEKQMGFVSKIITDYKSAK